MEISQRAVNQAAATAVATINATNAVARQQAALLATERAGLPTSGPGAVLAGGTEQVAR